MRLVLQRGRPTVNRLEPCEITRFIVPSSSMSVHSSVIFPNCSSKTTPNSAFKLIMIVSRTRLTSRLTIKPGQGSATYFSAPRVHRILSILTKAAWLLSTLSGWLMAQRIADEGNVISSRPRPGNRQVLPFLENWDFDQLKSQKVKYLR